MGFHYFTILQNAVPQHTATARHSFYPFPLAVKKISRMSKLARLTALDLPSFVLVPCQKLLAYRAPDWNGLRAVRLFVRLHLREDVYMLIGAQASVKWGKSLLVAWLA